jgi:DNA sulfur modification protein DndB
MKPTSDQFFYSIPAIRGIQAKKEYYVAMFPVKFLPALFEKAEADLPPELKAQRILNTTRIPTMTRYIVDNENDYVFSSLTASISEKVDFIPSDSTGVGRDIGTLKVPFNAKVLINDGQHRRAAIEAALAERPELETETISIVFYIDLDLKRSQQMFADLNRHAVRPSTSLGILYDHRDSLAQLCANLVQKVPAFIGMTEKENTKISNRANKLFTLSGIYKATSVLIDYRNGDDITKKQEQLARQFWIEVSKNIPDWIAAKERKIAPYVLRQDYIHTQGIALHAIAIAGNALVKETNDWKKQLSGLRSIDWSRDNHALWDGRAIVHGRINKGSKHIALTANAIKTALKLPLNADEQAAEEAFKKEYSK